MESKLKPSLPTNRPAPLASEAEIQSAYQGRQAAGDYVQRRFTSELMLLLHDRQVAAVNRIMRKHAPGRTLEIAPGPGRVTRDVRPAGELICLEFNEGMIAEGQAACQNGAVWQQGNAFELPFANEFDLIYSYRFVRHFHREDRNRLYAGIRAALRPGGRFVMDAVNQQVSERLRQANPDNYPIYDKLYIDREELRTELAEAGFEAVQCEPVLRWYRRQYQAQVLLGPRSQ
ncbi:MAG: class I SAM-dependent methyltransferase, partial [Planctomycetota bacterium]